jgi:hypothetical protein
VTRAARPRPHVIRRIDPQKPEVAELFVLPDVGELVREDLPPSPRSAGDLVRRRAGQEDPSADHEGVRSEKAVGQPG